MKWPKSEDKIEIARGAPEVRGHTPPDGVPHIANICALAYLQNPKQFREVLNYILIQVVQGHE